MTFQPHPARNQQPVGDAAPVGNIVAAERALRDELASLENVVAALHEKLDPIVKPEPAEANAQTSSVRPVQSTLANDLSNLGVRFSEIRWRLIRLGERIDL